MILFIYLPGNWGGGEVYIYIKTAKFYVENGLVVVGWLFLVGAYDTKQFY